MQKCWLLPPEKSINGFMFCYVGWPPHMQRNASCNGFLHPTGIGLASHKRAEGYIDGLSSYRGKSIRRN